ncbi:hypothetical protein AAMO2058_001748800 [Amorphochlora amoebiformis]
MLSVGLACELLSKNSNKSAAVLRYFHLRIIFLVSPDKYFHGFHPASRDATKSRRPKRKAACLRNYTVDELPYDFIEESGDEQNENPYFPGLGRENKENQISSPPISVRPDQSPADAKNQIESEKDFMARHTSEIKEANKMIANSVLSIFDRLGRSVHGALKNFNDPTKADQTPNLFVPLPLYNSVIRTILGELAGRQIRLDDYDVYQIHSRANIERVVRGEYLQATWGSVITTVRTSPEYPFNIRYSKSSENMKCIFVASAKTPDGTLVLSYNQKLV